jgi:hypothetical protein
MTDSDAVQFVKEAYKHCKTIAASGAASQLVHASCLRANELPNAKAKEAKPPGDAGVIIVLMLKEKSPRRSSKRLLSTDIGKER